MITKYTWYDDEVHMIWWQSAHYMMTKWTKHVDTSTYMITELCTRYDDKVHNGGFTTSMQSYKSHHKNTSVSRNLISQVIFNNGDSQHWQISAEEY